jgi:hypothetical protein
VDGCFRGFPVVERPHKPGFEELLTLPSLIRFLLVLAILGGLGYGAMVALVNFVEPQQREMSQTIPASKLGK